MLVGNAGGYLGLFLGYAALNVPELLLKAFDWFRTKWNKRKSESLVAPDSLGAQSVVSTDNIDKREKESPRSPGISGAQSILSMDNTCKGELESSPTPGSPGGQSIVSTYSVDKRQIESPVTPGVREAQYIVPKQNDLFNISLSSYPI